MIDVDMDTLLFFGEKQQERTVYERLLTLLWEQVGEFTVKIQKTQISFYNRHMFACVSFARVLKKAELPPHWLVLTFGLDHPKESERIAVCTEAARNRFTHHVVIKKAEDLNEELMGWLREAYEFSQNKR